MNHYNREVEILEKPVDTEADRKKRVEILLQELQEPYQKEYVQLPEGVETVETCYGFVVPREVYSSPEYREYLNHADNMKSVKVIVDEYYRKYPRTKDLLEKPKKKKHRWQH
jgi:hypothetical protein